MLEIALLVLGALGLSTGIMGGSEGASTAPETDEPDPDSIEDPATTYGDGFHAYFDEDGGSNLSGTGENDVIDFETLSDEALAEIIALELDMIAAGDGDDVIRADLTEGEIFGGEGDDLIETTSSGATTVFGMEGNDTILGSGVDIFGGEGDDTITSTPFDPFDDTEIQTIEAGSGADHVTAEAGNVIVHGRSGNDTLIVGGNSQAYAGSGDDEITITDGNTLAVGGSGDDILTVDLMVEPGSDMSAETGGPDYAASDDLGIVLQGGTGADMFDIDATLNHVQGGTSTPTLQTTITDFTPGEDVISIDFANNVSSQGDILTYFEHLASNPGTANDVTAPTSAMSVAFVGLVEASGGGNYTDIVFSTTGQSADGPVTQELAFRLEGVTGLDPASVVVSPDGLSLTIS